MCYNGTLKQPSLWSFMTREGMKTLLHVIPLTRVDILCVPRCTSFQREGVRSQEREKVSETDWGTGREGLQKDRDGVSLRTSKQGFNFPGGPCCDLVVPNTPVWTEENSIWPMKPNGNPTVTDRPAKAWPVAMVSDRSDCMQGGRGAILDAVTGPCCLELNGTLSMCGCMFSQIYNLIMWTYNTPTLGLMLFLMKHFIKSQKLDDKYMDWLE